MELLMLGAIVTGYWMYDCYESGQAALKQALIDLARSNFTGSNLKSGQPYQPVLRQALHSLVGLLVLGAIVAGYWVYDLN